MAMAVPLKQKMTKRSFRWSGSGLLIVLSLGLHGWLLGLPLPPHESAPPELLTEQPGPTAVVDVVRLPGSALVAEAIPKASAPAPTPSIAQAPRAAPVPQASQGAEPALPSPEPIALEPLPPEPPPRTLDDRLRDPAEYQFNEQAKSVTANPVSLFTNTLSSWLEAEIQGLSENDAPVLDANTKLAPLQVPYAINTCLMPAPAEGLVGVIVNTTGQLVKAPVLLDSTGYSVLDEKALEMASQRTFEPLADTSSPAPPRAQWLPVQVQYDPANCTS